MGHGRCWSTTNEGEKNYWRGKSAIWKTNVDGQMERLNLEKTKLKRRFERRGKGRRLQRGIFAQEEAGSTLGVLVGAPAPQAMARLEDTRKVLL